VALRTPFPALSFRTLDSPEPRQGRRVARSADQTGPTETTGEPEYRTPTDAEWDEFLGHFERRKVALGTCGRSFGTACIHEHSCIRCPLLRPDPTQRARLVEIRDNLLARINEARHEGWAGEAEGLQVSLAGARQKLAQADQQAARNSSIDLGMPDFTHVAGRGVTTPGGEPS